MKAIDRISGLMPYVKVRSPGRIVSVAVYSAVGVNTDGTRELLGCATGPSEAEPLWTEFLRRLSRRGLRGVELVILDSHIGLRLRSRRCSKLRGSIVAPASCATHSRRPDPEEFVALHETSQPPQKSLAA